MADVVYLLRHAEPPETARGRYWGKKDPGVDPDALARIAELERVIWVPPLRLFSSPLARATATAEPLEMRYGLRTETEPDLAEADFGVFDGLSWSEASARHPAAARDWEVLGDDFTFPAGESVRGFLDRVSGFWERCCALPDERVMCVTHGGVVSAWCCLFLRMPLEQRFSFHPECGAPTAFIRKKDGSGWEMTYFNNRP